MSDCQAIADLLPLYADGLTGEINTRLVEIHLAECPACREKLRRMREEVEADARADADYGKALRRQKRRQIRRRVVLTAAAVLAGAAVCLGVLWKFGIFYIVERQTSPNGAVTTTVYSRDVTGFFPKDDGCTLRDQGDFVGSTVYIGAEFEGLWWSPDSRYQVVSILEDGRGQMWLQDYGRNAAGNLTAWVLTAAQVAGMFSDAPLDDMEWPDVELRFIQWGEDSAAMLLHYGYTDTGGTARTGYFWYNCETSEVSGQMEME